MAELEARLTEEDESLKLRARTVMSRTKKAVLGSTRMRRLMESMGAEVAPPVVTAWTQYNANIAALNRRTAARQKTYNPHNPHTHHGVPESLA